MRNRWGGTWCSASSRAVAAESSVGSAPFGVTTISAPAARTVSWTGGVRVAVYVNRLTTEARSADTQATSVALTAGDVDGLSRARRTSVTTVAGSVGSAEAGAAGVRPGCSIRARSSRDRCSSAASDGIPRPISSVATVRSSAVGVLWATGGGVSARERGS